MLSDWKITSEMINFTFKSITDEEQDQLEEAITTVMALRDYDPMFLYPLIIPGRGECTFQYPVFGKVTAPDKMKIKFPGLDLDIVKSSIIRSVFGVHTERKNFFEFEGRKRCFFSKMRKSPSFPITQLKADEKEEFNKLVLNNWSDVIGPLTNGEITLTPDDRKRFNKLISLYEKSINDQFIDSLELREKDSIMMMENSTYSGIEINLPIEMSFGVFISTFVNYPSPLAVYRVMLMYISSNDVGRLYRRLKVLMHSLEQKTHAERLVIGIEIYLLFAKCERTRDIFFSALIQDNLLDEEVNELDILVDDPHFGDGIIDEVLDLAEIYKRMKAEDREDFEPIEVVDFSKYKVSQIPYDENNFYGLIYGKEFSFDEMMKSSTNRVSIYDQPTFFGSFKSGIRCYRPTDVRFDDERTLWSKYLEKRIKYQYVGK